MIVDLATTWTGFMEVDLLEVGRRRPLVGIRAAGFCSESERVMKSLWGSPANCGGR